MGGGGGDRARVKDRYREGGTEEKGVERKEAEMHITKINNFLVTAHGQYHVMYAYVCLDRKHHLLYTFQHHYPTLAGMKNTGYRPAGYNRKNSLLRHQISSSLTTGNSAQDELMRALAKRTNQSEAYSANRPWLK